MFFPASCSDELHTIIHCSRSSPNAQPTILELTKALRLFDLWSWATYNLLQQLGMLLGSSGSPPSIQRKHERAWTLLTTSLCIQFSHQIQSQFAQTRSLLSSPLSFNRDHSPANDTQCQTCQSPFDEEKMLLCDKCNTGWHLECIAPPPPYPLAAGNAPSAFHTPSQHSLTNP